MKGKIEKSGQMLKTVTIAWNVRPTETGVIVELRRLRGSDPSTDEVLWETEMPVKAATSLASMLLVSSVEADGKAMFKQITKKVDTSAFYSDLGNWIQRFFRDVHGEGYLAEHMKSSGESIEPLLSSSHVVH